MCCAGVTTSQASQPARSPRSEVARIVWSSGMPARNRGFSWRPFTASTTSGSSAQSRVSRPPAAATWASAVPQAPPPMTPIRSTLMP